MKAYLAVTALLFGLLTIAHIWRIVLESHLATDPWFLSTTVISTGMCLWGAKLLFAKRSTPPSEES